MDGEPLMTEIDGHLTDVRLWLDHATRRQLIAANETDELERMRALSSAAGAAWQAIEAAMQLVESCRKLHESLPYHVEFTLNDDALLVEYDRRCERNEDVTLAVAELERRGVDVNRPRRQWRGGAWRDARPGKVTGGGN